MILSKNDSHHAMMTTTNNNNQSIDPDTNRSRQSYRFLKKKSHFIIVAFKYSVKTITNGCYSCFDSASLPDQIICQNMIFKYQNILDTT